MGKGLFEWIICVMNNLILISTKTHVSSMVIISIRPRKFDPAACYGSILQQTRYLCERKEEKKGKYRNTRR